MRQIDEMFSEEIDILKLKGMLPGRDLDHRIDEREEWNSRDEEQSYNLRDEGRNPDGSGESYAERNV